MTNETPNHKLNLPTRGDKHWGVPLNQNTTTIDQVLQNISSDGATFSPTDLTVGNSITWPDGTKTTSSPTTGGGARQPVDAIVTVDNGTVTAHVPSGNEIDKGSEAGAVVQAALDHANSQYSNSGGRVVIGPGEFTLSTEINPYSNSVVRGAGMGVTVFKCTTTQAYFSHGGGLSDIVISDITMDGQLNGNRTGFVFSGSGSGRTMLRLEAVNCGPTPSSGGSTPSIENSGGLQNEIIGCRADNCSSVSIEAARGSRSRITGCVVTNGRYVSSVGFTHGIAIEKSDHSRIEDCYVSGSVFSPALNANNSSYSIVTGNVVEDVGNGLNNANGPCEGSIYANNTFTGFAATGIEIKHGNAGSPVKHLIANNVLDGKGNSVTEAISISTNSHANVYGNVIKNVTSGNPLVTVGQTTQPANIIGNVFYNTDGKQVRTLTPSNGGAMVFANNHFYHGTSSNSLNGPVVELKANQGTCTGNVVDFVDSNDYRGTLSIAPSSGAANWSISGNYTRGDNGRADALHIGASSGSCVVYGNTLDTGSATDNTGTAIFSNNIGLNGAQLELSPTTFDLGSPRTGSYTGDGTTGRKIGAGMNPEHVVIQNQSSGTYYDVHVQFGEGWQFNPPSGGLSIVEGGFQVDNGGSNGDPNVNGTTYEFSIR